METLKNTEKTIHCFTHILFVTTDPLSNAFLSHPLKNVFPGQVKVSTVENSNEALKYLDSMADNQEFGQVDVVLLDLDLPGRHGGLNAYQLARVINEQSSKEHSEIICGALTMFIVPELKERCLEENFKFIFDKTKTAKELSGVITKLLYPV